MRECKKLRKRNKQPEVVVMAVASGGGDASQWSMRGSQKRKSNNQPEVVAVARGGGDG